VSVTDEGGSPSAQSQPLPTATRIAASTASLFSRRACVELVDVRPGGRRPAPVMSRTQSAGRNGIVAGLDGVVAIVHTHSVPTLPGQRPTPRAVHATAQGVGKSSVARVARRRRGANGGATQAADDGVREGLPAAAPTSAPPPAPIAPPVSARCPGVSPQAEVASRQCGAELRDM